MERAENPEGQGMQRECCPLIGANVRRVVTLTCCFLLSCTLGIFYAFGNIDPYLTSYLRNYTSDHDVDFTDTLWINQAQTIVTGCLMPLVGLLANRIHIKLFMGVGLLFSVGSLVSTYWTVQQSYLLVVLTYGVVFGVPLAMVDPSSIRICVGWMPHRKGLACALVLMGYGVGAVMWNELITWYINPDNLQPDLTVGEDVYYTQAAVLDNVPGCFLMMGLAAGSVQVVCLLLLCLPPPLTSQQQMVSSEASKEEERKKLLEDDTDHMDIPPATVRGHNQDSAEVGGSVYGAVNSRQAASELDSGAGACCQQQTAGEKRAQAAGTTEVGEEVQYTPVQVLKSRVFWTLWLMMVLSSLGMQFVTALFKAYGQTFIHDDHFLALVASLSSVCNALGRPFWGMLADRIGQRMVLLITLSILAALVGSFMTCEETGKVGYMVWVCGMFLSMCGTFTMVYALGISLFGSRHYNVNLGLINSCAVVGLLLVGFVAPPIKDNLGWHGMFYISFGGLFCGVLLNMSLSIPWGDSIPRHMWPVLSLRS